jgi:hypothetical protein
LARVEKAWECRATREMSRKKASSLHSCFIKPILVKATSCQFGDGNFLSRPATAVEGEHDARDLTLLQFV